jgi:Domain of unknown function (DUF4189)
MDATTLEGPTPAMPVSRRFAHVAAALGLALAGLTPSAAPAYYACNGPGPGEIMIGMDNNTTPPTPLCEYVGEQGYVDPGPSGYWVERFAAIAWGTDPGGWPTYSWYVNAASIGEAEGGALAQCQASGFANCHLGPSVANGSLAIAVDGSGGLHAEWGQDNGQAKRKALRLCKKSAKGCKIEQVLESPSAWVSY